MSDNNLTNQVTAALNRAEANLRGSRLAAESERELEAMLSTINSKMQQLKESHSDISAFIASHKAPQERIRL